MKCAGLLLASAIASTAVAGIYTFDSDAQGWSLANDGQDFAFDGTIGNPGGAISARDIVSGSIWFFGSPTVEAGNRSELYGNAVTWDILGITGNHTSASTGADVMLTGNGMQIGLDMGVLPVNGQWTSWSALIDESAGWQTVSSFSSATLTGTIADEAMIRGVLSDLTGVYIRGEFTNGADSTAIDNVSIVPAPGALALMGLSGLVAGRRRR